MVAAPLSTWCALTGPPCWQRRGVDSDLHKMGSMHAAPLTARQAAPCSAFPSEASEVPPLPPWPCTQGRAAACAVAAAPPAKSLPSSPELLQSGAIAEMVADGTRPAGGSVAVEDGLREETLLQRKLAEYATSIGQFGLGAAALAFVAMAARFRCGPARCQPGDCSCPLVGCSSEGCLLVGCSAAGVGSGGVLACRQHVCLCMLHARRAS